MESTPDRISSWPTSFDSIRQQHRGGAEYWSARDLMLLLGYNNWTGFEQAIQRAQTAARSIEIQISEHFEDTRKVVKGGRWGQYTVSDVNLSRLGCYLVAMNCDPRKPAVAAAQCLFVVKTRWAETAHPQREMTRLELVDTLREAESERIAAEQRPVTTGHEQPLW